MADDPGGFEAVADDPGGTVVVGFHLYIPIYRRVLDFESGDLPRVFVGTGWDVWDQYVFSPRASHLLTSFYPTLSLSVPFDLLSPSLSVSRL